MLCMQDLEVQLEDKAAAAEHQEEQLSHQRALVENLKQQLGQLETAGCATSLVPARGCAQVASPCASGISVAGAVCCQY